MGELHLEIIVDRLKREFGVEANVGKPQVAYKETIRKAAKGEGRYIKQTGGRGQYGHAKIELEPAPGEGLRLRERHHGRHHPQGVHQAHRGGHPGGAGARHPGRLPGGGREGAALRRQLPRRGQLGDGLQDRRAPWPSRTRPRRRSPVLLEPIMKVEVVTPDDYTGAVTGDLSRRRGHLEGQISRGGTQIITAMVPLSNMFGYSTDLRSRTQGRATYSMHFEKYAEAPAQRERGSRGQGDGQGREVKGPSQQQRRQSQHGQGEVRPVEAAREHRDDRARGPREDVADGGDHEGAGGGEPEGHVQGVRPDRQRARGAGARGDDQRVARGVRDGEPSLRARGLPGSRGLHQEHDHGSGPDGRVDPGGVRGGRADAADAGAHPAGAAGGGSVDRGLPEQGGHGGRPGASGPGGAGGAGAAEDVQVPRGRRSR